MNATRAADRAPWISVVVLLTGLVMLSACASDDSSSDAPSVAAPASPSATEVTPSESATAALDGDDIFNARVSGYEFVEVPNRLKNQARKSFYASSGLSRQEARIDLQSITEDGAGVGVVMVVELSPEMAALPGTNAEGFAGGIAEEAGTQADQVDLGPTTGYVVNSEGQVFVAWQDENLLIALIGDDRADSVAAASAVAEATAS